MPESYYVRPEFYARRPLPGMVKELAGKFKYVDFKRFPKRKAGAGKN